MTSLRGASPERARRARPRAGGVLVLLVAAWAVPTLAYWVHAAWLLPPLVLLGTTGLVRGGRTLLDRLVLAVGLLIGLTCAVGLLFSMWAWGLHPVPVAGTAFTALLLVALLTGRRPAFPRPRFIDVLSVSVALATTAYLALPYLRQSGFTRRLGLLMGGEDNARHEAAFDVIGRLGGYLFVNQSQAREFIFSGMIYYPQGWHLTAALLDGFARRPDAEPGGPTAVDHYIFWVLAGYGLLLLVLIWLVQWLTGPMHPIRQAVAVGIVTALALGTELPRLLVFGYPSETLGLALALILAGLCIRPLERTREQMVTLGVLLVGLGFVYYLFVFPAGLLALAWLIVDRRRVLARPGTLIAVTALTVLLAPVTALLGLLLGGHSEALTIGGETRQTYHTLLVLGAVGAAGLLARSAWRRGVWRRYLLAVLITLLFAVAVALANVAAGANPGYYFIKTVDFCLALLIVGVAALARLLPVPEPGAGARSWIRPAGVAAAVLVAVLTVCGVIGWTGGLFHVTVARRDTTWSAGWTKELFQRQRLARATMAAYQAFPPVPGTVTLMIDRTPMDGYRESVYLSSLQGTSAQTEPGIYGMTFVQPQRLQQILSRLTGPVRLIAVTPEAAAQARAVLAGDPTLPDRVTIVTPPV